MVYDPALREVVLMGGYDNWTILAYTWTFVNNTWTQVLKNGPPPARSGSAIDYDPALGGVVLFAGNSEDLYMNDVWLFTGKLVNGTMWTSLWAYPSPPHRAVGRGIYDPVTEQFVVFGGQYDESGNGGSGAYLNDTWAFTAAGPVTSYTVSGTVSATGGAKISGATVYSNGTGGDSITTTGPAGAYSFTLLNGSYQITAIAPGFLPSTQSVRVTGRSVSGVDFTLSVQPVLPLPPTGLSGSASGSSSISLSWTNSAGTLTDDYLFYEAGTVCSAATEIDLGAVVTKATVTGLTQNTLYCAYVEDANMNGTSAPSATVDVTTSREVATNYEVTFTESGLSSGVPWSVTLNGTEQGATSATITFSEPNATYPFTVGPVAGYTVNPSSGSVTVHGAAVPESVTFTPVPPGTYAVTFSENGLPSSTAWTTTLDGTLGGSATSTITFTEANGTYSYSIGTVSGYVANSTSGSLVVQGAAVARAITFTPTSVPTYPVSFTETGLPHGTDWAVTLAGTTHTSTNDMVSFDEPNGSFPYSVSLVAGYATNPSNGNVSVAGAPVPLTVTFTAVYLVTLIESGLPTGTNWSVVLTASNSEIILLAPLGSPSLTLWSDGANSTQFSVSNGSYSYTTSAPGYTNNSGTFAVNGASPAPVTVAFTATTPPPSGTSSPSSMSETPVLDYVVLASIVVIAAIAVAVVLTRRRGRVPPSS
jgi:hypothetical protein